MPKYYAVKNGREPGIYTTWPECQAQVSGYSGAVYKSFSTMEEANAFINDTPAVQAPTENDTRLKIYVDGSFDVKTNRFSYGMAVIYSDGSIVKVSQAFDDPDYAEMRNVAGEIHGAMAAIKYCARNYIRDVIIYHDYDGIAKWPLREWQANKKGTQEYVEFYDRYKNLVNVEFRHVKGHSNDTYNDLVDSLAKQALGLI